MRQQTKIEACLRTEFSPIYFELVNESHMHNVPEGSESHFKSIIVSDCFLGKRFVQRHQMVYAKMGSMMQEIHALALHTFTEEEWRERGEIAEASPKCRGGDE